MARENENDAGELGAYHTTRDHGECVVVLCPGGPTSPLHPDDAEAWGLEILAAVNRARDVGWGHAEWEASDGGA